MRCGERASVFCRMVLPLEQVLEDASIRRQLLEAPAIFRYLEELGSLHIVRKLNLAY